MSAWQPPDPRLQRILNSIRGGNMGQNEYRVANMPRASIVGNAAMGALTANVLAQAVFDAKAYDTDSMWNSALPSELRCNSPGVYLCVSVVFFASDATASYRLSEFVANNGLITPPQIIYPQAIQGQATNSGNGLKDAWLIPMNKGDKLIVAMQSGVAGVPPAGRQLIVSMVSTL